MSRVENMESNNFGNTGFIHFVPVDKICVVMNSWQIDI